MQCGKNGIFNTKVGKKAGNTHISQDSGKYWEFPGNTGNSQEILGNTGNSQEILGNKVPCRQDDIWEHLHVCHHLNIWGKSNLMT